MSRTDMKTVLIEEVDDFIDNLNLSGMRMVHSYTKMIHSYRDYRLRG